MGVFGLTIPEEFGGFGLSKASMVVVSEELSRGYIGVGSLGTRSEIAAELILCGGTDRAEGAVAAEACLAAKSCPPPSSPNRTPGPTLVACAPARAKDGDDWMITGNKTWITHAARTHVMTAAGPHRSRHHRLSRPVDVPGRKDPRHRRRPPSPPPA